MSRHGPRTRWHLAQRGRRCRKVCLTPTGRLSEGMSSTQTVVSGRSRGSRSSSGCRSGGCGSRIRSFPRRSRRSRSGSSSSSCGTCSRTRSSRSRPPTVPSTARAGATSSASPRFSGEAWPGGLMSLVYYDRWMDSRTRPSKLIGPGAAAMAEYEQRPRLASLTPGSSARSADRHRDRAAQLRRGTRDRPVGRLR